MEKKPRASEQPIEVWEKELIEPLLIERKFTQEVVRASMKEMKKDSAEKNMPFEYKKRKRKQGPQRRFRLWIKGRLITVLTSLSWTTDIKKEGYFAWVTMEGKSIKDKLYSFPILNSPSFFETVLGYVDAFIDISRCWPKDPQCREELQLEFLGGGFFHMMKFECHNREVKHSQKRPSFLITEGAFSKKTLRFLKKKFMPSYRAQLKKMKELETNPNAKPLPKPRRFSNAQKRKDALAATILTLKKPDLIPKELR